MSKLTLSVLGQPVPVTITQDTGPVGGYVARIDNTDYSYWGDTPAVAIIGVLAVGTMLSVMAEAANIPATI